jgi:hypothetical protein
VHLYEQLIEQGYEPIVIKRGKKKRVTEYYHIPVTYLSDDEILFISKHNRCLITYCFWNENGSLASKLIKNNVSLIVHDPAEFHNDWIAIAKKLDNTIVIREKNKLNLQELGIKSTFIPHPYISSNIKQNKTRLAVAPARIDFRKHTEIICDYNNLYKNKIDIYGEINRLYDYHILTKQYPNWKNEYKGKIKTILGEQTNVISHYHYSIDLTAIKKDGGGTQYCFFESWDAGCILILNKKWDCDNSILKDKVNCLFVNDAQDIRTILDNNISYDINNARKILDNHTSNIIIPQYLNIMK